MRRTPSLLTLLLLLGAPLVSALTPGLRPAGLEGKSLFNGEAARAYEKRFDDTLAVRPAALSVWSGLTYTLLGEGRAGVLVGEDGWFFTAEEFAPPREDNAALKDILAARDALAARGTTLVIALIPDKSRVYEEHTGRYHRPRALAPRYETFRQALQRHHIPAPDLLEALVSAKKTAPVYLPTDTHWTPWGARVVADNIAKALPHKALPPEGTGTFTTVREEATRPHEGDLMRFLPLGALKKALGPPVEQVEVWHTTPAEGSADLLGDISIPGALVGTSYAADPLWNFIGFLKQALGLDFINLAAEGSGPFEPMRAFLTGDVFQQTPPQVIVWEIPERYLPVFVPHEGPSP